MKELVFTTIFTYPFTVNNSLSEPSECSQRHSKGSTINYLVDPLGHLFPVFTLMPKIFVPQHSSGIPPPKKNCLRKSAPCPQMINGRP